MGSTEIVYNIPIDLIEAYRGRELIVRVYDAAKLVSVLTEADIEKLHFVQILSMSADVEVLSNWGLGVPIDLVMYEPWFEFPKLYNFAKLLDKHPVRVTVPVRLGVSRAVKAAGALNFAVKLSLERPTGEELVELFEVLEIFLHQSTFAQPVEFFQGAMQAYFSGGDTSIWQLLEEDPVQYRFVTTEGVETISSRFAGLVLPTQSGIANFVNEFESNLLSEGRECAHCEFLSNCRCYFKWPDREYVCEGGLKEVFHRLKRAASELQEDLAILAEATGGQSS